MRTVLNYVKALVMIVLVAAGISVLAQGPLTNALNLRVRTDANGYLSTTMLAATLPEGPLTALGNIRLRTDASGYLITAMGSTGSFQQANGSNLEYGGCAWVSNVWNCQTTTNGGTARNARFGSNANTIFSCDSGQVDCFIINGSSRNFVNNSTGVISSGAAPGTALANSMFTPGTTFASLGTPTNGTNIFCSDCGPTTAATCPGTKASCICAGSGLGSWAFRANSVWYCPF